MTTSSPSALVDRPSLPESRPCSRCDGSQHLVAAVDDMGKYRCETCQLVVGFDLAADDEDREFLLDRGLPGRYTKDVFGPRLHGSELQL